MEQRVVRYDSMPAMGEGALRSFYEEGTPCRRCGRRVESNPSRLEDVCERCLDQVLGEAVQLLYDELLGEDWGICRDYLEAGR